LDFTLDRKDNQITGSFAIHGTGHGNITKGEFNPADKASPLHLEVVFTDGELKGQTRVLDGWFLYAESGSKKDENNDGKDDSSKTALPLLIGGVWKGGVREYKLEPISPKTTVAASGKIPEGSKAWDESTINPKIRSKMTALDEKNLLLSLVKWLLGSRFLEILLVPTRWLKPCTLVQDFSCYSILRL
jgi:hypothetical protein